MAIINWLYVRNLTIFVIIIAEKMFHNLIIFYAGRLTLEGNKDLAIYQFLILRSF